MQMRQDFAMRRDEMKNEREPRHQELAMQQQILQLQQQMMNMFMMTMMGQNNIMEKSTTTMTTMWEIINLSKS